MKKNIITLSLVLLCVGVFSYNTAEALTISPVRLELQADPGQVITGEFELFNEEAETKVLYSSYQNFEARGESGAPYFLPYDGTGLASWIGVPETVTLQPGERKAIPYSISIPADVDLGGYFAAAFWGTTPPEVDSSQVSVGGKLGILMLVSVGKTSDAAGILDFDTNKGSLFSGLPVMMTHRFSNDGGSRVRPEGLIEIKNIFGMNVATLSANPTQGNVLPQSVRKFESHWNTKKQDDVKSKNDNEVKKDLVDLSFFETARYQLSNLAIGPYKAELTVSYGDDQKEATASRWLFIFPWQLMLIVLIIIGLVGGMGLIGIRKYNRWILSQVRK